MLRYRLCAVGALCWHVLLTVPSPSRSDKNHIYTFSTFALHLIRSQLLCPHVAYPFVQRSILLRHYLFQQVRTFADGMQVLTQVGRGLSGRLQDVADNQYPAVHCIGRINFCFQTGQEARFHHKTVGLNGAGAAASPSHAVGFRLTSRLAPPPLPGCIRIYSYKHIASGQGYNLLKPQHHNLGLGCS